MHIKEFEFYQCLFQDMEVESWIRFCICVVPDALISSSTALLLTHSHLALCTGILLRSVFLSDSLPLTFFKPLLKGQLLREITYVHPAFIYKIIPPL